MQQDYYLTDVKNVENLCGMVKMSKSYIKDPFNYMGSKFKLLDQIYNLFPKSDIIFDVFGGSGCVGVNSNFKNVVYNDALPQLTEILKYFKENKAENIISEIELIIKKYNLSKSNEQEFLNFRKFYNENKHKLSPVYLYCLILYYFNYQIEFNSNNEFNVYFGRERSSFNKAIKNRLPEYINLIQSKNFMVVNSRFNELIDFIISKNITNTFVYLDPPYFCSDDSYSRTKSIKWTEELEVLLYKKCDELSDAGIKFALSNVFSNNNKDNLILQNWAKKYNTHFLDINYNNCNYQKDKKSKNQKVLITNY